MGGSWDATNVADAAVAVVLPIGVDHARYLGDTAGRDRRREGRDHQARLDRRARRADPRGRRGAAASGSPRSARPRSARASTSASPRGCPAVGGQMLSLQGLRARYDDVFLPLYGAHQAQNAAVALAAVEAFLGDAAARRRRWSARRSPRSTSPGRLEIVRRSPTIVLDAAHNPHGAEALAAALEDSFTFNPLIGVVGVMADKDHEGCWSPSSRTSPTSSAPRTPPTARCPPSELAVVAREVFGEDRVSRHAAARRRHRGGRDPGRGRRGLRRRRSAPAPCWSPARWSPSARRAPAGASADGERARSSDEQRAVPAPRHVRGGAQPSRRSPSA